MVSTSRGNKFRVSNALTFATTYLVTACNRATAPIDIELLQLYSSLVALDDF